jgi:hypothetical protein
MYLFGKLSRGFYDQDSRTPGLGSLQMLQYGQDKGRSFPGSGLRQSQNIVALKYQRYGLFLYWCRMGIARSPDCGIDIGIKLKLVEI